MVSSEIKVETLEKGCFSNLNCRGHYVVRSEAHWVNICRAMQKIDSIDSKLSKVDFSKEIVIGLAAGNNVPCCNCTSIDQVIETDSSVDVYYTVYDKCLSASKEPDSCQPYHFVKMPKTEKQIFFYRSNDDSL